MHLSILHNNEIVFIDIRLHFLFDPQSGRVAVLGLKAVGE